MKVIFLTTRTELNSEENIRTDRQVTSVLKSWTLILILILYRDRKQGVLCTVPEIEIVLQENRKYSCRSRILLNRMKYLQILGTVPPLLPSLHPAPAPASVCLLAVL